MIDAESLPLKVGEGRGRYKFVRQSRRWEENLVNLISLFHAASEPVNFYNLRRARKSAYFSWLTYKHPARLAFLVGKTALPCVSFQR